MYFDWLSLQAILVYSVLFGATMKLADLLDEHGLHWFKGDKLVFGILWGIFGVPLVLFRVDVANLLFARVLSYLPRMRLDYFNHAIAASIIFITFSWKSSFVPVLFFTFFALFLLCGYIRDYYGKKSKKKFLFRVTDPAWHYLVFTFIYSYITGAYAVFLVFTLSQLAYNAVKYGFYYAGWCKDL